MCSRSYSPVAPHSSSHSATARIVRHGSSARPFNAAAWPMRRSYGAIRPIFASPTAHRSSISRSRSCGHSAASAASAFARPRSLVRTIGTMIARLASTGSGFCVAEKQRGQNVCTFRCSHRPSGPTWFFTVSSISRRLPPSTSSRLLSSIF